MQTHISRKILRFSLKNIIIFVGIFGCSLMVYGLGRGNDYYKSVKSTTKIYAEGGSISFNEDTIEEFGQCWTIEYNNCSGDVFIPTKSEIELDSFVTAVQNQSPSCINVSPCNCTLRTFLNGVIDTDIDKSKIRNAMTGQYNDQLNLGGSYGNFVLGYGDVTDIAYIHKPYADEYVLASKFIEDGYPSFTIDDIYEFELHGITPATEGTNWGCLSDRSYWVNSNVYSEQLISKETGLGSWYTNFPIVNFGLLYSRIAKPGWTGREYNRFYGCKSELLPNPDKYCVERLIQNTGNYTFDSEMADKIYLKEFTNNYDIQNQDCSSIHSLADGLDFRQLNTGDFGSIDGSEGGGIYPITRGSALINRIVPFENSADNSFGTMNNVNGSDVLGDRVYRNTADIGDYGSTQIFGFYRNVAGGVSTERYGKIDVDGLTRPIISTIGYNAKEQYLGSDYLGYFMRIPLAHNWYYRGIQDDSTTLEFLSAKDNDSFYNGSYGGSTTGIESDPDPTNIKEKNVCVAFTCTGGMASTNSSYLCHSTCTNCDVIIGTQ